MGQVGDLLWGIILSNPEKPGRQKIQAAANKAAVDFGETGHRGSKEQVPAAPIRRGTGYGRARQQSLILHSAELHAACQTAAHPGE